MEPFSSVKDAGDLPAEKLLRIWFDDAMRSELGVGTDVAVGSAEQLGARFRRWMSVADIRDTVCNRWDYCEKRARLGPTAALAAALADFLVALGGVPSPFTVAVLFVQHGFDTLCDCKGAGQQPGSGGRPSRGE